METCALEEQAWKSSLVTIVVLLGKHTCGQDNYEVQEMVQGCESACVLRRVLRRGARRTKSVLCGTWVVDKHTNVIPLLIKSVSARLQQERNGHDQQSCEANGKDWQRPCRRLPVRTGIKRVRLASRRECRACLHTFQLSGMPLHLDVASRRDTVVKTIGLSRDLGVISTQQHNRSCARRSDLYRVPGERASCMEDKKEDSSRQVLFVSVRALAEIFHTDAIDSTRHRS